MPVRDVPSSVLFMSSNASALEEPDLLARKAEDHLSYGVQAAECTPTSISDLRTAMARHSAFSQCAEDAAFEWKPE
eukprot:586878-Lingulodinium_polyedra.AAC.1